MNEETAVGYRMLLADVLQSPPIDSVKSVNTVGSGWGAGVRPFRELLGRTLTVQTAEYLLASAARPVNVDYALASSAWILLGRDDFASLRDFNARGAAFTSDGDTLCAAFGARMRVQGGDQIEQAIQLLRSDPTSRRALVLIGRPDDLSLGLRDFPCATSLHFLIRDQALNVVVHMRSQSLVGVFPYDLVNFAYVSQHVASALGVPMGLMHWVFGSAHIYEDEVEAAYRMSTEGDLTFGPLVPLPGSDAELATLFARWSDAESREVSLGPFRP